MKILVTGGSGSIGKAFINKYKKTFNIVAPTHAQMDLTDARSIDAFFAKHKFDAVLHLAGCAERNEGAALEADNLVMFKNIQYMSIVYGVKKLIILGEGAETDRSRPVVDISEEEFGRNIPTDGYGLGRYLIHMLAAKDKITTSLRIFNVYGPGCRDKVTKIVAAGARGKRQIVIDENKVISGVYIDDAIKVIAGFLRGDYPQGDYNLVSGDKTSYLNIAKSVKRMVRADGGDIDIVVKSKVDDDEYTAVNDKLTSVMPVRFTTFNTGIKKLYAELIK